MVRVRTGGGSYRATMIDIGKESMKLHFIGFCPGFNYMLLWQCESTLFQKCTRLLQYRKYIQYITQVTRFSVY